jgi:hypothetical protein
MRFPNRRILMLLVAPPLVAVLSAGPASATASAALESLANGTSGPHHVTAVCSAHFGFTTNLGQITYVVEGTASAYSTNGSVPVGTSVTCSIPGYGSVSGGLPGADAVAAGLITVPLNAAPTLCATANAVFNDNGTASSHC